MKLVKQTYDACMLFSAAMVLDVDYKVLIEEIGHDGTETMFPEVQNRTLKQRSFHIQEIMDCFIRRGKGLMPIEVYPCTCPHGLDRKLAQEYMEREPARLRFLDHVRGREGILVGRLSQNGLGHASAWDGEKVYDPRGMILEIYDTFISEAWLVFEIKSDSE